MGIVEIEMLLCYLLAVLLMSSCMSAMPSMAAALKGPGIVARRGLLPSSRMFAARVLRSGNGSSHLIRI
jgi:hypothetical protein